MAAVEPRRADDSGPAHAGWRRRRPGVISLPISGSVELPHWTEPATGEVPRVIIGVERRRRGRRRPVGRVRRPGPPVARPVHRLGRRATTTGVADLIGEDEDRRDARRPRHHRPAHRRGVPDLRGPRGPPGRPADRPAPRLVRRSDPHLQRAGPARRRRPRPRPRPPRPRPRARPRRPPPAHPVAGPGAAAPASARPSDRATPPIRRRPARPRHPHRRLRRAGPGRAGPDPVPLRPGHHHDPGRSSSWPWPGPSSSPPSARGGFRPATLLGLAAVAALPLAAYWRGEPAIPLVLFLTTAFGLLWFILGLGAGRHRSTSGVTLLGHRLRRRARLVRRADPQDPGARA